MGRYDIKCFSLSKQFFGNKHTITAIDDINLHINENELVIIRGRSGAGKSTLINLMSGLIRPSRGKVFIGNDCINELSDNSLSDLLLNRIGIIFQSFNLLPTYTIYENIELALAPKDLGNKEIKKKVLPLLEQFQLSDKAQLFPSELSVGQQQKVAIIRTLVKQPSIIFADEPTGSVDAETAGEILEFLVRFKNENRITLVVATHGSIPENIADRIYTLEKGHIVKNDR